MCLMSIFLLGLLFIELFICSYTDVRVGKIYNNIVFTLSIISLPIQVIEIMQRHMQINVYILNVICVSIVSILFYLLEIWAAGDAKLIISIAIIYPHHYYWPIGMSYFPAASLIVTSIAVTYVFILIDTIFFMVFEFNMVKKTWPKIVSKKNVKYFLMNWICITALVDMVYILNNCTIYLENIYCILIVAMAILLFGNEIRKLCKFWPIAIFFEIWHIAVARDEYVNLVYKIMIAAVLFIFSRTIQIFNYKIISTDRLQSGMIISALSARELEKNYHIKLSSYEDHSARVSESEVKRVVDTGIDNIRIVRKMPFAIFSLVSIVLYIGVMIWQTVY